MLVGLGLRLRKLRDGLRLPDGLCRPDGLNRSVMDWLVDTTERGDWSAVFMVLRRKQTFQAVRAVLALNTCINSINSINSRCDPVPSPNVKGRGASPATPWYVPTAMRERRLRGEPVSSELTA